MTAAGVFLRGLHAVTLDRSDAHQHGLMVVSASRGDCLFNGSINGL